MNLTKGIILCTAVVFVVILFQAFSSTRDIQTIPTNSIPSHLLPSTRTDTNIVYSEECLRKFKEIEESDRATWIYESKQELDMFLTYWTCKRPFALMRYGDGEKALIDGLPIRALEVDHWGWKGGVSKVGEGLKNALQVDHEDFYIGLPCENWTPVVNAIFAISKVTTRHTTYAIVFINNNYVKFRDWFKANIMTLNKNNTDIILVVNEDIDVSKITWARDVIFIPNEAIVWWEEQAHRILPMLQIIAKQNHRKVFLFSGGPLAKVIIYEMWKANKNNLYVDLGSASDEMLKGTITRSYQSPNSPYNWGCKRYQRGPNNQIVVKPQ